MAGATDYSSQKFLDWQTGVVSMPATTNRFLGLFTTVGSDDGTGFVEVSGGNYARAALAGIFGSSSGSAPSITSSANPVLFNQSTAPWGTVLGWGIFDALGGGNLVNWDYVGAGDWLEFTCSNGSPGVLTVPSHGFSNGDSIVVNTEFLGGSLPSTISSWAGLLTVANITTDTFDVGINTTSSGSGAIKKVTGVFIDADKIFSISAGQLVLRQS